MSRSRSILNGEMDLIKLPKMMYGCKVKPVEGPAVGKAY